MPTTVAQTYSRAERSLREGGVYHSTITGLIEPGNPIMRYTREVWVDLAGSAARLESRVTSALPGNTFKQQITLVFKGGLWNDGSKLPTTPCPGLNAATVALLGCPTPAKDTPAVLEPGTYAGHPVLTLVWRGTIDTGDQVGPFTTRTYLDRTTALPLARLSENRVAGTAPRRQTEQDRHQFMSRDSLPKDFFDPASLGWHL
jgi:hypothetical protein